MLQQLTQQQARRAATDDGNLGAHGSRFFAHATNFAKLTALSIIIRREPAHKVKP
jgi:hypothetical protein